MLDFTQPKPAEVSDLEHFRQLGTKLSRLRIDSVKAGEKIIEYIGTDGKIRREYYHSGRWNDRPAKIGDYAK